MEVESIPRKELEIDRDGPLAGIEFATVVQLFGELIGRFDGAVLLLIAGERAQDGSVYNHLRFHCDRQECIDLLHQQIEYLEDSEQE